ncbi:hypothetical protein B0H16DRAFT_1273942, partial [Mycena metata]
SIGMEKAIKFIRMASRLKDSITSAQRPTHDASQAPDEIPGEIRDFLSAATDMPLDFVDGCWKAFANLIW